MCGAHFIRRECRRNEATSDRKYDGGVAEWFKAPRSKCGMWETASEVQILPPPYRFFFINTKKENARIGKSGAFSFPNCGRTRQSRRQLLACLDTLKDEIGPFSFRLVVDTVAGSFRPLAYLSAPPRDPSLVSIRHEIQDEPACRHVGQQLEKILPIDLNRPFSEKFPETLDRVCGR